MSERSRAGSGRIHYSLPRLLLIRHSERQGGVVVCGVVVVAVAGVVVAVVAVAVVVAVVAAVVVVVAAVAVAAAAAAVPAGIDIALLELAGLRRPVGTRETRTRSRQGGWEQRNPQGLRASCH